MSRSRILKCTEKGREGESTGSGLFAGCSDMGVCTKAKLTPSCVFEMSIQNRHNPAACEGIRGVINSGSSFEYPKTQEGVLPETESGMLECSL